MDTSGLLMLSASQAGCASCRLWVWRNGRHPCAGLCRSLSLVSTTRHCYHCWAASGVPGVSGVGCPPWTVVCAAHVGEVLWCGIAQTWLQFDLTWLLCCCMLLSGTSSCLCNQLLFGQLSHQPDFFTSSRSGNHPQLHMGAPFKQSHNTC